MRSLLNSLLLLLALLILGNETYALNNYQIRVICKNQKRKSTCVKNLQRKRIDFLEGKRIEIPVIPYRE